MAVPRCDAMLGIAVPDEEQKFEVVEPSGQDEAFVIFPPQKRKRVPAALPPYPHKLVRTQAVPRRRMAVLSARARAELDAFQRYMKTPPLYPVSLSGFITRLRAADLCPVSMYRDLPQHPLNMDLECVYCCDSLFQMETTLD